MSFLRETDGKAHSRDDVSGADLEHEVVVEAQKEEIDQLKKRGVYGKVKEDMRWAVTGKAPVGTRRGDARKGGESNLEYRSRLVPRT